MNHICYISIGSNLGDRIANCEAAILELTSFATLIKVSSFYETEPWGYEDDHYYLNAVIKLHTSFEPKVFLSNIQNIEKKMGRQKNSEIIGYQARIIDLDILYFDRIIYETDNLIIPHPKLYSRKYVLQPLLEIAPQFICPLKGQTILSIFKKCQDRHQISLYMKK